MVPFFRDLLTAPVMADPSMKELLKTTQGHILEKHGRCNVWNFLLRFQQAGCGSLLARLPVTIASTEQLQTEPRGQRSPVAFLGFSQPGAAFLGKPLQLEEAFEQGFRRRAKERLGVANPKNWKAPWDQDRRFDALLICAADTTKELEEVQAKLTAHFGAAVTMVTEKCAVVRANGNGNGPALEHFGFADGVSQPVVFPNDPDARQPAWASKHNPQISLSQVLVADPWNKNFYGSCMSYMRIEQHVSAFDAAAQSVAAALPPGTQIPAGMTAVQYAAALIVGRHKDGRPLINGGRHINDFDRSTDRAGMLWPCASHTAKMNPRTLDRFHQRPLMRRGMRYEDGAEKGLIFQSFQPQWSGWFEDVLTHWAHNPDFPSAHAGRDPMMSEGGTPVCFPTGNPTSVTMASLTTIRGGEYFFFPSIPSIQSL